GQGQADQRQPVQQHGVVERAVEQDGAGDEEEQQDHQGAFADGAGQPGCVHGRGDVVRGHGTTSTGQRNCGGLARPERAMRLSVALYQAGSFVNRRPDRDSPGRRVVGSIQPRRGGGEGRGMSAQATGGATKPAVPWTGAELVFIVLLSTFCQSAVVQLLL